MDENERVIVIQWRGIMFLSAEDDFAVIAPVRMKLSYGADILMHKHCFVFVVIGANGGCFKSWDYTF